MLRALVDHTFPDGEALNALFERHHVPLHQVGEVGQMGGKVSEALRVTHGLQPREHVG